ncbi:MAG: alpha/beta fold hydrolase, partial [Sandaracinobacteroides sp.]
DIEALVAHLGLKQNGRGQDFVLGGYSLGARTVVRLLARGLRPSSAILAGMGLKGIVQAQDRGAWFIRMIEGRGSWPKGTGEFVAESFMNASVKSPDAIIHLLRGQENTSAALLGSIDLPVAVICGADDTDNGSAPELAAALPRGQYVEVPGSHMSAVTRPELAAALLEALGRPTAMRSPCC